MKSLLNLCVLEIMRCELSIKQQQLETHKGTNKINDSCMTTWLPLSQLTNHNDECFEGLQL